MKTSWRSGTVKVLILAGLVILGSGHMGRAQSGPPALPPVPDPPLGLWTLTNAGLASTRGFAPRAFTNLNLWPNNWGGNALSVGTNVPAFLNLNVYETDWTNVTFDQGSIALWCSPNWTSAADGGTGPGAWAPLWQVGAYSPSNAFGCWSLAISPDGNTLSLITQTNGAGEVHLQTGIAWDAGDWHYVVVTYCNTNCSIFLEGSLFTNAAPIIYWPNYAECVADGWFIGSDSTGVFQAQALFQGLRTYDYPVAASWVLSSYKEISAQIVAGGGSVPFTGGSFADSVPTPPGGGGGGGGSSYTPEPFDAPRYTTNQFWLENLPFGTNSYNSDPNSVTFILHETTNACSYQLWSATALSSDTVWTVEQTFVGANGQNWTPRTVSMSGRPTLFFQAINYSQDSSESGLPDWWKTLYGLDPTSLSSSTNSVSDAYAEPAGDGWSNLQKFQNGWNPNVFHTPPPPLVSVNPLSDDSGVVVSWQANQGAVISYTIFRNGISIATVSSNQLSYLDTGAEVSGTYQVRANYAVGDSSLSAAEDAASARLTVSTAMCRGPDGEYFLLAPNLPSGVSDLVFLPTSLYTEWPNPPLDLYAQPISNLTASLSGEYFDVPVTNFVNGRYALPDSLLPYFGGYQIYCLAVGTNGSFGPATFTAPDFSQSIPGDSLWLYNMENRFYWNVLPFLDGTMQLQQNLVFQLESADQSGPFQFAINRTGDSRYTDIPVSSMSVSFASNYACANFHQRYATLPAWVNEFKPFEDNYFYRNFVVNSSADVHADGSIASGVSYDVSLHTEIPSQTLYAFPEFAYALLGGTNPITPLLTTNAQAIYTPFPAAGSIGLSYVNDTNIAFASAPFNFFGLDYQSVIDFYTDGTSLYSQTFLPGTTVFDQSSYVDPGYPFFYAKVAAPHLNTIGYFFGQVDRDNVPGDPGFNPTNITAPMIASVGVPLLVGGWAKQAIVNGNANQYGFLEMYWDKAFIVNADGDVTTNQTGLLSEYGEFFPTDPGLALLTSKSNANTGQGQLPVPIIGLYADANHDGIIDTSFSGPDFVTPYRPFRFWVNDNNDSGDTTGNSIPGYPAAQGIPPNGVSGVVNGARDLVDFFPVYVDIASVIQEMQNNSAYDGLQFRLSQLDGALNFIEGGVGMATNGYGLYLTTSTYANAAVTPITSAGVLLTTNFLRATTNGGGIILVEAWTNTAAPLVLDVLLGTNVLAQAQLPLSITGVEQMFRHKNLTGAVTGGPIDGPGDRLTDSDAPNEPDNNGTNFIFVHGYNVNPTQARGWQSEMFKRLYWSGSHARFYGVTWMGYDSQQEGVVTINLQTNVLHAFQTASAMSAFLNSLAGPNITMAHSLGNLVVLSALNDYTNSTVNAHFMLDAAIPLEAIDGSAAVNTNMVPSDWLPYPNITWASEWFNLFTSGDPRNQLTWSNRLSNFRGAQVYNFYSSGEEVLRNYSGPATSLLGIAENAIIANVWSNTPFAANLWALQEKEKGRMSSDLILSSSHGGWGYNTNYGSISSPPSPSLVEMLTFPELRTNPVFNIDVDGPLFGASGNTYAQTNGNRILAQAIPAVSWAIGANPVPDLGIVKTNVNMKTQFETGWPAERPTGSEALNWYHSDVREVAYPFTHSLFDYVVSNGGLK